MKTLLLWLIALVICVAGVMWIGSAVMGTVTNDPDWPGGLGKLSEMPKRYPATKDSPGATKLVELASKAKVAMRADLDEDGSSDGWDERREAMEDYVGAQLERSGDAIDAPPPALEKWLTDNDAALDAVRDHLLSAPILWESDLARWREIEGPHLRGHNHLNRIFLTRALLLARAKDPAAWEELRAAKELTRALWTRPSYAAPRSALSASRLINGAARKMPVPAPAWFADFLAIDYDQLLWRAHQAGAWHERYGDDIGPGRVIGAHDVEKRRHMVEAMMSTKACDTASPQFQPVLTKLGWRPSSDPLQEWQPQLRFRAELEATRAILQLRSGQVPERASRCSDGSWVVTPASVKFTRDVKAAPPAVKIPLEYSTR